MKQAENYFNANKKEGRNFLKERKMCHFSFEELSVIFFELFNFQ